MEKISSVIFLSFAIILLLVGCLSVPVKDEPKVEPPNVKATTPEPPKIEPPVVEPIVITPSIPDGKVWEPLGRTKSGDNYYNKTIITKSSKSNIISVSTYKIVADDFRQRTIKEVKKYNLAKSIKYQYYEHDVRVDEIDCKNRRYRVKELMHYDDKGNVLDGYTLNNEEWKSIPILTAHHILLEKFCVAEKKPLNQKKPLKKK